MEKDSSKEFREDEIYPGKTIALRLPATTPDHQIKYLNELKHELGRGFTQRITKIFTEALEEEIDAPGNKVIINLPGELTKEEMDWILNPLTRQMVGQWLYQLIKGQVSSPIGAPGSPAANKPSETENPGTFKLTGLQANISNMMFNEDD